MISKSYSKTGKKCRVTFRMPSNGVGAAKVVHVLGDFNGWDPEATPLKRRKDGSFSATAWVESGRESRFRYLVDGRTWVTDEEADGLAPNRFGELDSLIVPSS